MSDPRSDELLLECGQIGRQLGISFAWTDSLQGAGAKACSRSGAAAWKNAKPLPKDEQAAVAFFLTRARKRNPAVALGASGLVGIEADGELEQLRAELAIPAWPDTVTVRSRRGPHSYLLPPTGRAPIKVQIDVAGVVVAEDGYLIGAGALHPCGHVYRYEHTGPIAEMPVEIYDRLVELGERSRAETRRRFAEGEVIPKGNRDVGVFWLAVDLLRDGHGATAALERVLRRRPHAMRTATRREARAQAVPRRRQVGRRAPNRSGEDAGRGAPHPRRSAHEPRFPSRSSRRRRTSGSGRCCGAR